MYANNDCETDDPVSLDEAFRALGRAPRRRILEALRERDPRTEVTVAELCGGWVEDGRDDALVLYHNHLPRLDAAGFVDWDREADTVSRGPRFDEIRPLLALCAEHVDVLPDDWP